MHPSPNALADMTTADLNDYREYVRNLAIEHNDLNGAYQTRINLIDAILSDRKADLAAADKLANA